MEQRRDVYRVLAGKSEEKKPFGRPRRRWEDKVGKFGKWDVGA
jgi:hypothetical protein